MICILLVRSISVLWSNHFLVVFHYSELYILNNFSLRLFPYLPYSLQINTVKPVLNGNIFRSRDYHSIPWLNGNLASAEKCSGLLRFRLRKVLLYYETMSSWGTTVAHLIKIFSMLCGTWRSVTMVTTDCHWVLFWATWNPHPLILFLWDPFQHFSICT
jgi:hypothetical protein